MTMRWVPAIVVAVLANVGLFVLMHVLIDTPVVKVVVARTLSLKLVEVPVESPPEVEQARPADSEAAEVSSVAAAQLPPVPVLRALKVAALSSPDITNLSTAIQAQPQPNALPESFRSEVRMGKLKFALASAGAIGGTGSPQPRLHVKPGYPPRAQAQSIEGFVELQFDIQDGGTPANIVIVDESPRGVFGRSAKQAIRQWRYEQSTVGLAVRKRIDYQLDDL